MLLTQTFPASQKDDYSPTSASITADLRPSRCCEPCGTYFYQWPCGQEAGGARPNGANAGDLQLHAGKLAPSYVWDTWWVNKSVVNCSNDLNLKKPKKTVVCFFFLFWSNLKKKQLIFAMCFFESLTCPTEILWRFASFCRTPCWSLMARPSIQPSSPPSPWSRDRLLTCSRWDVLQVSSVQFPGTFWCLFHV